MDVANNSTYLFVISVFCPDNRDAHPISVRATFIFPRLTFVIEL